ncbi:hypothetical protein PVAND_011781 [Polypedilum vanderplanki]|uniref:Uncharacterized protein n=1 Tax=Polypedilum vanderplanki TaxID=319348 RepID=A0A9J6CKC4_POLVA|nr:hypothetical protein PVAND_011781 [Polypedilum vanderplanki]
MSFYKFLFTPRLFRDYNDGSSLTAMYNEIGFEKLGGSLLSFCGLFFNFFKYGSPVISFYLYKRGYFSIEHFGYIFKVSTGIGLFVVLSYCIRAFGRSQSDVYKKFINDWSEAKENPADSLNKKKLRLYDFEFDKWPIDWSVKHLLNDKDNKSIIIHHKDRSSKVNWMSPCSIAAFIAIHTFGLKMIYPGSISLINKYLHSILVQGRTRLVKEKKGNRYKIQTIDDNEIDTMFIDNRNTRYDNGRYLVVCAEGNAGFYEIGIMSTAIELNYSVLGFNHPGFAGSSGEPYPSQEKNAAEAVIQFAIHQLGFLQENIILFGWSIGAYDVLFLASQYPNIKGVIVDATFDDLLYLAIPRMPESLSSIVRIAIRDHCNLNNSDLINQYNGPILMIRRTEDEIICTEEMNIGTNRGNYLLMHMLSHRFPNIFKSENMTFVQSILNKTIDHSKNSDDAICLSLIMSYIAENSASYPMKIGEEFTEEERNKMAVYLIKNHMLDYKSSHCTPLLTEFFKTPWSLPIENDFVFT